MKKNILYVFFLTATLYLSYTLAEYFKCRYVLYSSDQIEGYVTKSTDLPSFRILESHGWGKKCFYQNFHFSTVYIKIDEVHWDEIKDAMLLYDRWAPQKICFLKDPTDDNSLECFVSSNSFTLNCYYSDLFKRELFVEEGDGIVRIYFN